MDKFKIIKNTPYLEAIVGPMFSGKTIEIDRRLTNVDYYNKSRQDQYDGTETIRYIILRPITDHRSEQVRRVPYANKNHHYVSTSDLFVDSRSGESIDLINDYDYIILDEAQFFSSEIISQIKLLLANNKYVIVAGLDKDYRGEPFSDFMKWVLCVADDVTKLTAICVRCGAPSTMAKLITLNKEEVLDGNIVIEDENHRYVPMCRKCMNIDE